MRNTLRWLAENPWVWIKPLIAFAAAATAALVVRHAVLRALRKWAQRVNSRPGLIAFEALRVPTLLWIVIVGAQVAVKSSAAPEWAAIITTVLAALWILSLTILGMRIARDVVRYYGAQIPGAMPVTSLTQNLAQIVVVTIGALFLLRMLGVEITPILTALGVGGLAVALALQDTLSNLFSGFYVAVAGQVRIGDYVKLNTGEEGYVTDISWRSTTIRALANNMVIVPNSKLAQAVVTNYYLPEKRMGTSIQVTVTHDSDIAAVEAALLDVAMKAAGEAPGMLAEPAPSVAFDPGFTDSGLVFTVNFQVAEFLNQFGARNELRKRVIQRFREEGIRIPVLTPALLVAAPEGGTLSAGSKPPENS